MKKLLFVLLTALFAGTVETAFCTVDCAFCRYGNRSDSICVDIG